MRTTAVGWCNDRLGEVRTMRLGALLMMVGFALLPLATSLPTFVVYQLFLPVGTALLFPANSALVSHARTFLSVRSISSKTLLTTSVTERSRFR
jgi:MFS family permease